MQAQAQANRCVPLTGLHTNNSTIWICYCQIKEAFHPNIESYSCRFLQRLPAFLQPLVELLVAAGAYQADQGPQHVLVNRYKGGAGIGAHMDGPLYSACVATITLGGPALMAFHETTADDSSGSIVAEVYAVTILIMHTVMQSTPYCSILLKSSPNA